MHLYHFEIDHLFLGTLYWRQLHAGSLVFDLKFRFVLRRVVIYRLHLIHSRDDRLRIVHIFQKLFDKVPSKLHEMIAVKILG